MRVLAGRYELVRFVGRGGMGEVWEGRDRLIGRHVAVKLLPGHDAPDAAGLFLREARTAGSLSHHGVVTVHDMGRDEPDGTLFLVMEFLSGRDLATVLRRDGRPPVAEAADWTAQTAAALAAAHRAGVVHRDVKPANLMLTDAGRIKVLDFGLARFTESSTRSTRIMGTLAYMAPERLRGHPGDVRTDLYALGCVLYELLTGRAPFGVDDPVRTMTAHLYLTPVPPRSLAPGVPEALDGLAVRLLAKDPADRPQHAEEVQAELRAATLVAPPEPGPAPPDPVRVSPPVSLPVSRPAPTKGTPAPSPATGLPLLADPVIPEYKRFCSACAEPVGRGGPGFPGEADGYCEACGTTFSFTPDLAPGDVLAGRFTVLGVLAHTGTGGAVHLAEDAAAPDRRVVVKRSGTRRPEGARGHRALASLDHPGIVAYVDHVVVTDAGEPVGHLVEEYAPGRKLSDVLHEHRDGLPVTEVVHHGVAVLDALAHLHDRGFAYCDMKPHNIIRTPDGRPKLYDLSTVVPLDAPDDEPIYGTWGYWPPEIASAHAGASIAGDVYTVGRTLAMLSHPFALHTPDLRFALPPVADVPVWARHPEFHAVLERATRHNPADRFASAHDMRRSLAAALPRTTGTMDA